MLRRVLTVKTFKVLLVIFVLAHSAAWQLCFAGGWVAPYEKAIGWLFLVSMVGTVGSAIGLIVAVQRRPDEPRSQHYPPSV